MEDNFSIRNWKNKTLYKEAYEGNDHYVKFSKTNDTYQVWKGEEIVTDFPTKERAEAESKRLNLLASIKTVDSQQVKEQDDFDDFEEDEISVEIPGDEDNAPAGDKSLNKKLSKQDGIIKRYKELSDLMQLNLKYFKDAPTEDVKNLAKSRLKDLTPEYQATKKAYEELKGINI